MTHGSHAAFSWPLTFLLLCLAVSYALGWVRLLRDSSRDVAAWRAISFLLGLALLWIALASPLAHLDVQLLTIHMVKHLLTMTVAPALLLLGEPLQVLLAAFPHSTQTNIVALARLPMVRGIARFLTRPVFCWLIAAAAIVVWHIPVVLAFTLNSEPLHIVASATFFLAGTLFWWPVIRPWPSQRLTAEWSLLIYLFAATIPCDILSAFLVFSERVVYPVYFGVPRTVSLSVQEDQICAGALMWTTITILYLVPAAILTMRFLSGRASHTRSRLAPSS